MKNKLFKKVPEETNQVVRRYTDSVDKVVAFLKENPGSDSIDIQIGTGVGIAMVGRILERSLIAVKFPAFSLDIF